MRRRTNRGSSKVIPSAIQKPGDFDSSELRLEFRISECRLFHAHSPHHVRRTTASNRSETLSSADRITRLSPAPGGGIYSYPRTIGRNFSVVHEFQNRILRGRTGAGGD